VVRPVYDVNRWDTAAAAACVVGIVVDDEFSSTLDGEGGVGKLSFVGFFWCPG